MLAARGGSCEELAIFTAEALRRREMLLCFQNSAPQRLCGEGYAGIFSPSDARVTYSVPSGCSQKNRQ